MHLRANGALGKTYLSATFDGGIRQDVTDKHGRFQVKHAATTIKYPATRGVAIGRVNTQSLRSGGVGGNALTLLGYSDTQIQKMGR